MIEDAPIVKDTRRIRSLISNRFGNDVDKYLAHLRASTPNPKTRAKARGLLRALGLEGPP